MRTLFNIVFLLCTLGCVVSAFNAPDVAGLSSERGAYIAGAIFFAVIGVGGNYYWNRGN